MTKVTVRGNNVEKAIKVLKKKLVREGLFKEVKQRRFYEKPSEKRVRKAQESYRRTRKSRRQQNSY